LYIHVCVAGERMKRVTGRRYGTCNKHDSTPLVPQVGVVEAEDVVDVVDVVVAAAVVVVVVVVAVLERSEDETARMVTMNRHQSGLQCEMTGMISSIASF
jgi:hypothetical protein